jgi:hypothetical protein
LCDAHGIGAENPLNLPTGFHLAITKLLAKFDVILLLESVAYRDEGFGGYTPAEILKF